MQTAIVVLRGFGYVWNTVAGIIWAVLLVRNGWLLVQEQQAKSE